MSAKVPLSKIERVTSLREVWPDESLDFTPWLAQPENIKLLGETLRMELEVEAKEKPVGPFFADILCKDTATSEWAVIENQIEKTDHAHLGQLLTYAAGLEAATIVWIAKSFTDEHRAALDWLNQITDERFSFFGLEVELWKIGDSPLAPNFNIVSKPNDWSKNVAGAKRSIDAGGMTEGKQIQMEFWTAFRAYLENHEWPHPLPSTHPGYEKLFGLGRSGFRLAAVASFWDSLSESYSHHELRAELALDGNDSKQAFETLKADRDAIEAQLGEPLTWHSPDTARRGRIRLRKTVDLRNRADWPNQHEWLRTRLEMMRKVFLPRIKNLSSTGTTA